MRLVKGARARALELLDSQIEAIYYRTCQNVQISVLDIGKVFAAGRAAAGAGQDIEAAVVATVAQLRKN